MTSSSYLTELVLLFRNDTDQDCAHHTAIVVCLCFGAVIFAGHSSGRGSEVCIVAKVGNAPSDVSSSAILGDVSNGEGGGINRL